MQDEFGQWKGHIAIAEELKAPSHESNATGALVLIKHLSSRRHQLFKRRLMLKTQEPNTTYDTQVWIHSSHGKKMYRPDRDRSLFDYCFSP